jgi:NlpC/P60 family
VTTFLGAIISAIGDPYEFGGDSPSTGFDCSGLIYWAAEQAGIPGIPRTSEEQYAALPSIPQADTVPGDLVFFLDDTAGGSPPGHVGICADDGCSEMINAPQTGEDVSISSTANMGTLAFGQMPGSSSQIASPTDIASLTSALASAGVPTANLDFNLLNPLGITYPGGSSDPLNWPSDLGNDLGVIGTFFSDVISPNFWKRVGIGALGVLLVVGGVLLFVSQTKTGQEIKSNAGEQAGSAVGTALAAE